MTKLKPMLPYLAIILADFYLLPLVIGDTGTAMVMMLVIIPAICFVTSIACGRKQPSCLLYTAIVAVLFFPSIFIYYNSSAMLYVVVYAALALAGSTIGKQLAKPKKM